MDRSLAELGARYGDAPRSDRADVSLADLANTWPARLAQAIWGGVTLPGDVYSGRAAVVGDDGRTSPEVIERASDLAGVAMLGTTAAPAGALGSGFVRKGAAPLPMDEASRMARADELGFTKDAYHATGAPDFSAFRRRQNDVGMHFGTPGQAEDRLAFLASTGNLPPGGQPRTIPARLKANNSLRLEDAGWWSPDNLAHEMTKSGKFSADEVNRALYGGYTENPRSQLVALRNLIEGKGYDSIVYRNSGETTGGAPLYAEVARLRKEAHAGPPGGPLYDELATAEARDQAYRKANAEDSYVVFHPNQIRSRFAAFDPAKAGSADLLASLAGLGITGAAGPSLYDLAQPRSP